MLDLRYLCNPMFLWHKWMKFCLKKINRKGFILNCVFKKVTTRPKLPFYYIWLCGLYRLHMAHTLACAHTHTHTQEKVHVHFTTYDDLWKWFCLYCLCLQSVSFFVLKILELLYSSVEFAGCDSLSVDHRKRCVRAAVRMMSAMTQRQPPLTKMFLTDVLLEPMLLCLENHGNK